MKGDFDEELGHTLGSMAALVAAYWLPLDWLLIVSVLRLARFIRQRKLSPSERLP